MVIYCDLMEFVVIYVDLMGIYVDLMVIYMDLIWFIGDSIVNFKRLRWCGVFSVISWWFDGDSMGWSGGLMKKIVEPFMGHLTLVFCYIAIENCHRNSGFTHSYVNVYQRV